MAIYTATVLDNRASVWCGVSQPNTLGLSFDLSHGVSLKCFSTAVQGLVMAGGVSGTSDRFLSDSFDEWLELWTSLNTAETDEEGFAILDKCSAIEKLMAATPADTIAGILAKEKWMNHPSNISVEEYGDMPLRMFKGIIDDMKRIGGHHA